MIYLQKERRLEEEVWTHSVSSPLFSMYFPLARLLVGDAISFHSKYSSVLLAQCTDVSPLYM